MFAFVDEAGSLGAGIGDLVLELLLAAEERRTFAAPNFDQLAEFPDAGFERDTLAAQGAGLLLFAGQRDTGLGQGGVGGVTLATELFQFGGELGHAGGEPLFLVLELGDAGGELRAFLGGFAVCAGEAVQLEGDVLDLLRELALAVLERAELAFTAGHGDFLLTELRSRLLDAGLDDGLFALQGGPLPAGVLDL